MPAYDEEELIRASSMSLLTFCASKEPTEQIAVSKLDQLYLEASILRLQVGCSCLEGSLLRLQLGCSCLEADSGLLECCQPLLGFRQLIRQLLLELGCGALGFR